MKYLDVTALHDSDTYPRIFFYGMVYRVGYGVFVGYEQFGERFYVFQRPRFENGYKMICALRAEDAKYYFGVEAGDFD